MQAVRLCHITTPPSTPPSTSPSPSFTVQHEDVLVEKLKDDTVTGENEKLDIQETEKGDGEEKQKGKGKRDPLRMFGILTPQSLRTAQKEAVEMVERIIPRLVSIDAEMREVEIQVRRARKFRGKAEGVELKDGEKVLGEAGERRGVLVD
jgi:coiled-coil domain-containing protein 115